MDKEVSFAVVTKEALLQKKPKSDAECRIMLCAATVSVGIMTLRRGMGVGVKYVSESLPFLKTLGRTAARVYDIESQIEIHDSEALSSSRSAELILYGHDAERILYDAGLLTCEDTEPCTAQSDTERIAFLRGAYLACGTMSDPNKSYHLEMTCRNEKAVDMCIRYATELGIVMRKSKRKNAYPAYMKDSDSISAFLSLIGADAAVLELENVRIIRESRNYANRTRNCDLANIDRSGAAAKHQIEEIERLLETGEDQLSDVLRETAHIRIQHPDATLTELAQILNIGKSGVNHRLQKLLSLADKLHTNTEQK